MAAVAERPTLSLMPGEDTGDPERGRRIVDRREALGMTRNEFSGRKKIDRETVKRAEESAPGVRSSTYGAIEKALSELEDEIGMNDPERSPGVARFIVRGVYGVESLIVEGPVENIADLERSVDRIMRRLRETGDET